VNAKRPSDATAGPGVEKLPHELSLTLAQNLVAARKAIGMSQRELAQQASVARDHLIRIERGEANVGLGVLMNLARAVGKEAHELLNPHSGSDPQKN
jgi:transcriptional regulator with XRE-family HTH domain